MSSREARLAFEVKWNTLPASERLEAILGAFGGATDRLKMTRELEDNTETEAEKISRKEKK